MKPEVKKAIKTLIKFKRTGIGDMEEIKNARKIYKEHREQYFKDLEEDLDRLAELSNVWSRMDPPVFLD